MHSVVAIVIFSTILASGRVYALDLGSIEVFLTLNQPPTVSISVGATDNQPTSFNQYEPVKWDDILRSEAEKLREAGFSTAIALTASLRSLLNWLYRSPGLVLAGAGALLLSLALAFMLLYRRRAEPSEGNFGSDDWVLDEGKISESSTDGDTTTGGGFTQPVGIANSREVPSSGSVSHSPVTDASIGDLGINDQFRRARNPTVDSTIDTMDSELGFGDLSEVNTMLDLARVYIDMGDSGRADSMLLKAIESGDDTQKAEAESLSKQLL